MKLLFKNSLFENDFLLEDESLIFKSCSNFNYTNIYNDNYVVQGFTIARDYCLISAYSKKKNNSRVYLYSKTGEFKKYVELDNSYHVGGISYDYINDIVYITGAWGKINAYSYSELILGNVVRYNSDIDISKIIDGVVSAATLYFYDNKLYVCTFEGVGKMVIFDLEFSEKVIRVINSKLINTLPAAIQGVCVFKNNQKLYYLFSQSYSKLKSTIKLYDENFMFLGQKKFKCIGLEGIDIDYTGNVCGVFENGIDKTMKVHVSKLIFPICFGLEKKYYLKGSMFQKKLVNIK